MEPRHPGLAVIASLLLQSLPSTLAAQYISVPWSSKYYGPDGPWQAVKVTVGGTSPDVLLINEDHKQLDLLPGGEWNSKILTSKACKPYKNSGCGSGGTWDPISPPTVTATGDWRDEASKVNSSGQGILLQASTVESFSYWNTSLVLIEDIAITNPDGSTRGPELGSFALGGPEQSQKFATDSTFTNVPMVGFSYGGGAYNHSATKSFSYGLHIGSAHHNYPGSLLIGGYDKGRLVGSYTSFNAAPLLLDISIGVATGGSPWAFKEKKGLLLSNTSRTTTVSALPDPRQPYIHLPGKTCEEIAKHLPITFDPQLRYWLWDTTNPSYQTIITSPAYLGFTFPPAYGASLNVTIKVPFSLLNLTLSSPITQNPVPYFPCQAYEPSSSAVPYILGRAFLQAAFIGRNWNRQVSWLGQAPGPGLSRNGLGNVMVDIADGDVDLRDVFMNAELFMESWAGYWTVLPDRVDGVVSATASSTASNTSIAPTPAPGLSIPVKAGIGLGAAAVVLLAIGVVLLFLRYQRKKIQEEVSTTVQPPAYADKYKTEPVELDDPNAVPEMQTNRDGWTYELGTEEPQVGDGEHRQRTPPVERGDSDS
ncbi:aspartic-type endopeptidase [Pyrenophora seminiperda CCB06]|uniref:Aspartic-type endopeptidase n=1 Tax=Pyrenophora seminiperda CCB06 TaxID=1302712 RepID=A0A3M7MGI7_9PLEO|nr:aspartic-type endopeptidase [Pyrenophora seminiperda CCB06]